MNTHARSLRIVTWHLSESVRIGELETSPTTEARVGCKPCGLGFLMKLDSHIPSSPPPPPPFLSFSYFRQNHMIVTFRVRCGGPIVTDSPGPIWLSAAPSPTPGPKHLKGESGVASEDLRSSGRCLCQDVCST